MALALTFGAISEGSTLPDERDLPERLFPGSFPTFEYLPPTESTATAVSVGTAALGSEAEARFPDIPPSPAVFEREYQALGRLRGERATATGRARARTTWLVWGASAAEWLVQRLTSETDVEVVSQAVDVLADLGVVSFGPVLRTLGEKPTGERLLPLLEALAFVPPAESQPTMVRIVNILKRYIQHSDADFRDHAYHATRALPGPVALDLLREALATEPSADLRSDISAEIEFRSR